LKKEKILILFGADSSLEWGRSYQWAKAFNKLGHDVFYVDLPEPITNIFRKAGQGRGAEFSVFTPKYALPAGRVQLLKPINKHVILSQIRGALLDAGFRPTIIWAYSPYEPLILKELIDEYKPWSVVYDCGDERVAMAEQAHGKEAAMRVKLLEEEVASYCDAVFAETETLQAKKACLNERVFSLENGIDTEMFSPEAALPIPAEYKTIKGRIMLYTGTLASWVDLDLMKKCAESYPDDSIVVVGPSAVDDSQLKGIGNIHLLGPRPYREMPAYIKYASLCLIPFRPAKSLFSTLKALQYAAMGKPVLSTHYDGIQDYGGLLTVAMDKDEFLRKAGELASAEVQQGPPERQKILDAYSWQTLASRGIEILRSTAAGA